MRVLVVLIAIVVVDVMLIEVRTLIVESRNSQNNKRKCDVQAQKVKVLPSEHNFNFLFYSMIVAAHRQQQSS